ncbi:hypothetical protein [Chromohalobacter canadensis]|nr:hypothetical protein [Chromohalobacter canadensis]MCT8470206.1 hypothetical protein [Chromohalobacter canadensis]
MAVISVRLDKPRKATAEALIYMSEHHKNAMADHAGHGVRFRAPLASS